MAFEYKSFDVANEDEENIVEFWTQFGWELKSSQRVYNQDTHLVYSYQLNERETIHRSVTDVTDFTKLVFQRDKNMTNYYEICEIEEEYLEVAENLAMMEKEESDYNKEMIVIGKLCDYRPERMRKRNSLILRISGCSLAIFLFLALIENSLPWFLQLIGVILAPLGFIVFPIAGIYNSVTFSKWQKKCRFNKEYFHIYEAHRDKQLKKNPKLAKLFETREERKNKRVELQRKCGSLVYRAERLLRE